MVSSAKVPVPREEKIAQRVNGVNVIVPHSWQLVFHAGNADTKTARDNPSLVGNTAARNILLPLLYCSIILSRKKGVNFRL
jgi:hypothetical protein